MFLLAVIYSYMYTITVQMLENSIFACRVVNIWNSLPAECTNFSSLNSFRHSLSSVDFSKFLTID